MIFRRFGCKKFKTCHNRQRCGSGGAFVSESCRNKSLMGGHAASASVARMRLSSLKAGFGKPPTTNARVRTIIRALFCCQHLSVDCVFYRIFYAEEQRKKSGRTKRKARGRLCACALLTAAARLAIGVGRRRCLLSVSCFPLFCGRLWRLRLLGLHEEKRHGAPVDDE